MDKENPLNQQVNSIPSDALNTPSKEQEQLLETSSQNVQNSNNNANKRCYSRSIWKRFPHFNREYKFIVIYYHTHKCSC